jgi:ABC-type Na+ efflux pump permease subunit
LGATPNGRGSKEGKIVQMMAPFAFVFLMLMAIMTTGQYLLSNVIEEKSSRIVEVLLSAVRPGELMAGKIIGLGLVGLMVAGLWLGGGLVALEWRGIELDLPASIWAYFLVYYVLGYLLLASLMAGAGSLCSEPKEAASLIGPINMILIIPMIGWYNFAQEPMGLAARLLSFVPPITPLMMMLRLGAGEIPAWEVAATLALLLVSTVGAIWLAGKVFRVGVLMYGKRPGLKTVWRAVRAS